MKHVDFRKQLAKSIFDYYSGTSIADRTKKRRKQDSDNYEHNLISLNSNPETKHLKSQWVQRRCMGCHKRTTTCCSCADSKGMCADCWARHIRTSYIINVTRLNFFFTCCLGFALLYFKNKPEFFFVVNHLAAFDNVLVLVH